MRHTLQFGIGLHHAGLADSDRKCVEALFVAGKIQVHTRALKPWRSAEVHCSAFLANVWRPSPESRYSRYVRWLHATAELLLNTSGAGGD